MPSYSQLINMNKRSFFLVFVPFCLFACSISSTPRSAPLNENLYSSGRDSVLADSIVYHPVRVDHHGNILPWFSSSPGLSYDHVLNLVWTFWKNIETDSNGIKYYMNHQVWRPNHDHRGLGGDQVMMSLSSWDLYYNYSGDVELIENMKYMADYYLEHSLSPVNCKWPIFLFHTI